MDELISYRDLATTNQSNLKKQLSEQSEINLLKYKSRISSYVTDRKVKRFLKEYHKRGLRTGYFTHDEIVSTFLPWWLYFIVGVIKLDGHNMDRAMILEVLQEKYDFTVSLSPNDHRVVIRW